MMHNLDFISLFIICAGVRQVFGSTAPIILPPQPLGPNAPICTSYNGLCHLAYNLTDNVNYQVVHSSQEICRCPSSQSCEVDWAESERSLIKTLKSAGHEIDVKISYCTMHKPNTVCRPNEPAIITRGRGAFLFEIVGDFKCRCYTLLFEHRSWQEGDYQYVEYSCGKHKCNPNSSNPPPCTEITYKGSAENLSHVYLCRCGRLEECGTSNLPTATTPVVYNTCEKVATNEIYRRRRIRRNSRMQTNKECM